MQIYKQEQTFIKHRCKADITATILEAAAAAGGTTKAKIYYRSFLTYQRSKGYLLLLEENGLIEYDKEKCIYKTTEKGLHTLQAYNGMRELIDYC